jgi:hypothetical protein
MRTLLIILLAAAICSATVVSTRAQNYSPNALGDVDILLTPGLNVIANPLDAGPSGNTVANLLAGVPDGTCVYTYTPGSGFIVNDYTTLFGWSNPNMSLAPGEGAILYLPPGPDITLAFVGEVPQGTLKINLVAGYNLVASTVPQAGGIQALLEYTPANGDIVYISHNALGYMVFHFDGFWLPLEPFLAVGQGVWIQKAEAGTWERRFSVN